MNEVSPAPYTDCLREERKTQDAWPAVENVNGSLSKATTVDHSKRRCARPSRRCIVRMSIVVVGVVIISTLIVTLILVPQQNKPTVENMTTTVVGITASSNSTNITNSTSVCFDGDAWVTRKDGSRIPMRHLKRGDTVLVAQTTANGNIVVRPSLLLAMDVFQKHNHQSTIHYREIFVSSNTSIEPLRITPRHALLMRKETDYRAQYRFASDAVIGDELYWMDTDDVSYAIPVKIIDIREVHRFDAYAPLTFEGNIIVNGIVASCYGTWSHDFVHWLMAPRRWLLYHLYHTVIATTELSYVQDHPEIINDYLLAFDPFPMSMRNRIRTILRLFDNVSK